MISVQPAEPLNNSTTHLNTPGANYNCLFQNEWCEVAVLPVESSEHDENGMCFRLLFPLHSMDISTIDVPSPIPMLDTNTMHEHYALKRGASIFLQLL